MSARLSAATLDRLAPGVARPAYPWAEQGVGIVHLGIGAFHRAHQAAFTEAAMAGGDRDWAIAGVSLRSGGVRDALAPQDGLYTLTERGAGGARTALIGAVRRLLVAPEAPEAVTALIAAPGVRIVSLTVTEKAYAPGSAVYAVLAQGLAARRAAGLPGLTMISCDNLADNGGVLARGLADWLGARDPALRAWVEAECACPATMVDRIVPAPTDADRAAIAAAIGLEDAGAIVTEPFRQWVIEDRFAGPRPRWELAGARFVAAVTPFEAAKLRLLNGAHSALAYLGLAAGHDYVHQAIADPAIAPVIEQLMRAEAAPGLAPAPELDVPAYIDALLARFRNPALPHRLAQIAIDGSVKLRQRWLPTLAAAAAKGRRCPAMLRALAAWLVHVRGEGAPVSDPLAADLAAAWAKAGREGIVRALFLPGGLMASDWVPGAEDEAAIVAALG